MKRVTRYHLLDYGWGNPRKFDPPTWAPYNHIEWAAGYNAWDAMDQIFQNMRAAAVDVQDLRRRMQSEIDQLPDGEWDEEDLFPPAYILALGYDLDEDPPCE